MNHLAQQQFIANASSRLRAGRVRIAGTTGSLGEIVAGKTNNIVAGDKNPPNTLTDTTNSLSYGGINMEKADHGQPTSSEVQKNPEKDDMNTPQAWLLAGQWKYNYLGALKEAIAVAQARGKILEEVWPTEKQQLQFFAGIPGDPVEKNKIMNGGVDQFAGYRHPDNGDLVNAGDISIWWVASSQDGQIARDVGLERGDRDADSGSGDRDFAFSLRFLSDKA